jgi:dsDNA-specific endonuclease/ATPase MutS2
MTDLSSFNPTNANDLFRTIIQEGEQALGRPIENVQSLAGHLRRLAEDSLKTAEALLEGRIDAQTAQEAFEGRKEVLLQMREFVELTALQAAQRAADAIFRVIGWAIFNRTGINVAPGLVHPT